MSTKLVILGVKEISKLYGLSSNMTYRLLNTKGCPLLPRENGAKHRVIQDEFEKWMRSRTV